MSFIERALTFPCAEETLVGVLARPESPAETGVVIIVGGPQTRIGSHRQFVLLARQLAAAGYPVLRFDYRGMGDASGDQRDFLAVSEDIGVAIDTLTSSCPLVKKIVLWGLCDAASAALLYLDETDDPRVSGLILLNPWVRSAESLAQTQIEHYYGRRLLEKEFWWKLFTGRLPLLASAREFFTKLRLARTPSPRRPAASFQERMARAWRAFPGRILLILAGEDYTAKEFLAVAASDPSWQGLLTQPNVYRQDVPEADHTFSSTRWRKIVENHCLAWLSADHAR